MKKLLILLFSILISLNSYGEWLLLGEDSGNKFYYEVDTIKTSNGYIYYWDLVNFSEPFAGIYMSGLRYKQGDCGVFRDKTLSGFLFTKPMGRGENESVPYDNSDWEYYFPNTEGYNNFTMLCSLAEIENQ